jgi:hypothetical protein
MGAVYRGKREAGKSVDQAVKETADWAVLTGTIEATATLGPYGGAWLWRLVPPICVKIALHPAHHPFGTWGPLVHWQWNWWIRGVKGSAGVVRWPIPPMPPPY